MCRSVDYSFIEAIDGGIQSSLASSVDPGSEAAERQFHAYLHQRNRLRSATTLSIIANETE